MARPRATTAPPTFVQAREGAVMLVDGEEKFVRFGDIFHSDHPLVRRMPEIFVELGELPETHPYRPPAA